MNNLLGIFRFFQRQIRRCAQIRICMCVKYVFFSCVYKAQISREKNIVGQFQGSGD